METPYVQIDNIVLVGMPIEIFKDAFKWWKDEFEDDKLTELDMYYDAETIAIKEKKVIHFVIADWAQNWILLTELKKERTW